MLTSQFVDLPQVSDARGTLCFAENRHLPFELRRVFWIFGVPEGETRGGHAHTSCAEVVFPVRGSFDILVDDGHERTLHHMDDPSRGILIPPCVWCELSRFSADACCVVFASHDYQAEGYIHDYATFLRTCRQRDEQ